MTRYRIVTVPYDGYLFYDVQRRFLGLFWCDVSLHLSLEEARKDLASLKATGEISSFHPTIYYE